MTAIQKEKILETIKHKHSILTNEEILAIRNDEPAAAAMCKCFMVMLEMFYELKEIEFGMTEE